MSKALLILASLRFSQALLADRCEVHKDIALKFPASSFNELRLNALAGDLTIEVGNDDVIEINGTACSDHKKYLDDMSIDVFENNTAENGSILELTVIIPYDSLDWDADYAHVDLDLRVPRSLLLAIRDASGNLEASGVTLASLEDSSGDIRFRDTRGNCNLRDSSGDISIRDHDGTLTLEDSSGNIAVSEVEGSVIVEHDSSGDIEINQVSGFVTIHRDSSGDIEIDQIGKNVMITSDSSGSIDLRDVHGSAEIGADGSGDVTVKNIGGDFTLLSKGKGDIKTSDVAGNINIP